LGPFDGFIWFFLALTELIRRTSFTKDHEELENQSDFPNSPVSCIQLLMQLQCYLWI
jgi:hypothetical protein